VLTLPFQNPENAVFGAYIHNNTAGTCVGTSAALVSGESFEFTESIYLIFVVSNCFLI
jgi:hypothetical protein